MGKGRQIVVEFLGEDKSLSSTARKADGSVSKLGGRFGKVAAVAGGALVTGLGAAAVGLYKAGQASSDLSETQSKVKQIFGAESVGALDKFAKGAAASMGQSRQSALDAAATFGMFGKMAGKSGKDLVGFSTEMTGLASDMASFNNSTPQEAIDAIGAALRGEAEPIRRFGVLLDDATLKSQAMKMGLIKTTKEALTPQQKVLASQAAILAQTKDQQGDFARTSDGLANKQRILAARFENIKVALGKFVVPWLLKATDAGMYLLENLTPLGKYLQARLGPVFAKVGGFLKKFGKEGDATSGKFGKMAGALKSIFKSVVSIVKSAVSIVSSLWERFGDTITKFAVGTFKNIVNVIAGAFKVIAGIFKVVASVLKGDWKGAWDGIKQIVSGAWQIIKAVVSQGWNTIKALFSVAGSAIKGIFSALWAGLKAVVTAWWNFHKAIVSTGWNTIKSAFSTAGSALKSIFSSLWSELKSRAAAGVQTVVAGVKALPGKIKALGSSFLSAGKDIIGKFIDGLSRVGGFAGEFASGVWAALKRLINSGIDHINAALDFTINMPNPIPDVRVNPRNIPHLYRGGIIPASKYGMPFVGGDRGHAEAVIPLTGPYAPNFGGGGDTYITLTLDSEVVHRALVRRKRTLGRELGLA